MASLLRSLVPYGIGDDFALSPDESEHPELWVGLQGAWLARQNSGGTILDRSGGGNAGAGLGGAEPPTWTFDDSGHPCAFFGGTTAYVEIPSHKRYDNPNLTVSWWFKVRVGPTVGGSSADPLVARAGTAGASRNGFTSYIFNNGSNTAIYYECDSAAATVADSSGAAGYVVVPNVWYHVALVLSQAAGGVNRLYVNGAEYVTGQTTNSAAWTFAGQVVRLADTAHTFWLIFDGWMRDVLWHSRALTAAEIKLLAIGASPFTPVKPTYRRWFLPSITAGIVFDAASNSGYQAASGNYVFNRTVGTGNNRFLAVEVSILGAPGTTVTSVTDDDGGGNVAMTFIGRGSSATGAGIVEFWGLVNPISGTKSIRVQLSGAVASAGVARSYENVNQASPYANFNSAQATNVGAADATVTITTVATGSWVLAAIATDDTTVTANQTSRNNVSGAGGSGADEDTGGLVAPGTTAMSYTNVGALATWVIGGYELRPDTAAGLAFLPIDLAHMPFHQAVLAM